MSPESRQAVTAKQITVLGWGARGRNYWVLPAVLWTTKALQAKNAWKPLNSFFIGLFAFLILWENIAFAKGKS